MWIRLIEGQFERGTVSYMVTATLTRPTTIAPTTTRSAKLKFQDSIDIESMYTSKSRVISLEPVSRRGKVKVVKPSLSLASHTANGAPQLTRNNTQTSTATRSTCSVGHPPLSPAPSDDTVATATTTSTPSSQPLDSELPGQKASPPTSETRSNTTCSSAHTITASTELPRHGALPGDTIPIRVSIVHTKPNVRGVVISTLYRQARVDMHPPIPLANRGKVKRAEYEDVYPRSRTGLGGLYFTHSSPSSVFRMDLSQSSTMMVVDPHTLTAEIKTSIKVPDTAFPTISNVPGGMISFTYHIEVVVDLFGKFGETRFLPRLTSSEPTFTHTSDPGNQLTSDWSNSILDTTQLRRTKSVITFEMSVVVGTKDSSRKQRPIRTPDTQDTNNVTQSPDDEWQDMNGQNEHFGDQFYDPGTGYYSWDDGYQPYDPEYYYDYGQNLPASNVVPPPPDSDEGLDEKGRLQRDERLLLPSRPPEDGDTSGHAAAFVPSAPDLASESISDGIEGGRQDGTITPSISTTSASVGSARSAETIKPDPAAAPPLPSTNDARPTDDKRELERRRLLAEASAPPVEDGDGASRSVPSPLAPTAPALPEDDEYNFQTLNHDDLRPALPQYEQ